MSENRLIKIEAHRGIEWVELAFPDVNMLVHVNVNVPEEVRSHALKAKFRKHGTNPCKQKLSGAIFVWGEVAKSVEQIKEGTTLHVKHTPRYRSPGQKVARSGTFTFTFTSTFTRKYVIHH